MYGTDEKGKNDMFSKYVKVRKDKVSKSSNDQ